MALNKAKLKTDIKKVFSDMKAENAPDTLFASGISSAIVTFVKGCSISTVDAGTVSGGVYSGSSTGSGASNMIISATDCQNTIQSACNEMKKKRQTQAEYEQYGNDYLAEEIGKGIKQMSDAIQINLVSSGTLTPPSGPVVSPYGGANNGGINCSGKDILVAGLKLTMRQMYSNREVQGFDGDDVLAGSIADLVNTFYTTGIVNTNGEGNIAGATGTGSIS